MENNFAWFHVSCSPFNHEEAFVHRAYKSEWDVVKGDSNKPNGQSEVLPLFLPSVKLPTNDYSLHNHFHFKDVRGPAAKSLKLQAKQEVQKEKQLSPKVIQTQAWTAAKEAEVSWFSSNASNWVAQT